MAYVLFETSWVGRTISTASGLKSLLKNPRTCGVARVLRLSVTSNAILPTRASGILYVGSLPEVSYFTLICCPEPPRDCRRPFGLNYAAMAVSSSKA